MFLKVDDCLMIQKVEVKYVVQLTKKAMKKESKCLHEQRKAWICYFSGFGIAWFSENSLRLISVP